MSGADINFLLPLTRLNPWFPGQFGVGGAWTDTGLRLHSTGTIFYVSPNHPGASDSRDGTDPNDPLLTIGAALQRCQSFRGDVIAVMPVDSWTYGPQTTDYNAHINEEVTITVHGVRLVGVSSSPVGVPWYPASDGGTCITVRALDVIIEGFVFSEDAYTGCDAIYAEWDGTDYYADNLTIRHCFFDDTVDTAIELDYCWFVNIHDCVFQECDAYGIYANPANNGAAYMQVYRNVFRDVGTSAIAGEIDDSLITQNWIYNESAATAALATNEGINLSSGNDNLVADNWLSCALTGGGNGDYDDLNSPGTSDAWVNNHCMNGDAVTNPT